MAERRTVRRRPDDDEADEQERERGDGRVVRRRPHDDEADRQPRERGDGARDDGERSGGRQRPSRRRDAGLTAAEVAQEGLRQIAELTGKEPEGVTGVEPAEDGWLVGVELVEDRRIPSSTDILATYEVEVDPGGELVSYHRVRRYPRGRGDSKDS